MPDQAPTQTGPKLPSRRATAAIAGAVLAASIGLGAALPGGKADSLASERSPLSAALLAQIAAQRATAGQTGAPASSTPAGSSSVEPEGSTGQESTPQSTSGQAGSGAGSETSSGQETPEQGSETSGGSSETSGEDSKSGSGSGSKAKSGSGGKATATPVPASLLAQITHVWAIVLSGGSFAQASSSAPYLTKQLVPQGTLLAHYELVGPSPASNDIALLSGQAPNPETEKNCPAYTALAPATLDSKSLSTGSGCVYPATVHTLADQTAEAALTWRAYIQDMAPSSGGAPTGAPTAASTCRHPSLGAAEPAEALHPGNDYLLARNPFVFFDSLLESQACAKDDVDLSRLSSDLATPADTPSLSWIVPGACSDGAQAGCGSGATTGLPGADAFLEKVVPEITATSAYKQHGLILITFDSAASSAGSQVGALVLSPFARAGKRNEEAFNTYSLLRSLERLFGVPLLGHAADQGVTELDAQVYRTTSNTTLVRATPRQASSQTAG
jgi:hypothetical protein